MRTTLLVSLPTLLDPQYHPYDLGVFDDWRGWLQLWTAPGNDPHVQGIWVDRAGLVREEG